MEEVEFMSLEVDIFLERMKREYLEYTADQLPAMGKKAQQAKTPPSSGPSSPQLRTNKGSTTTTSITMTTVNTYSVNSNSTQEFNSFVVKHRDSVLKPALTVELPKKPAPLTRQRTIGGLLTERLKTITVEEPADYSATSHNFAARMATRTRKESAAHEMLDVFASTVIQARNIF